MYEVKDDFESTKSILKDALAQNDVVLVSGGISVGDYDFVSKALKELDSNWKFQKGKMNLFFSPYLFLSIFFCSS